MLLPNLSDEATALLCALYLTNSVARRYQSPENNEQILERVRSFRVTPSETAIQRALNEMIGEGMQRADGGNEQSDAINAARVREAKEKAHLDRVAEAPLSPEEIEYFQRLSQSELRQLYFGDRDFKVRFDLAVDRFGFQRPLATRHPSPVVPRRISAIPPTIEPVASIHLTPIEYRSMPSRVVQARYTREPLFKAEVDRLIREGQI